MGKSWLLILASLILVIVLITAIFVIFKKKVAVKTINNNGKIENVVMADKPVTERVVFQTDDAVEIVADYTAVPTSRFAAILLHMMPADRQSFSQLATVLNKAGYTTLNIDLRGHGESVNSAKGKLDYKNFDDAGHQASRFDLAAASNFLKSKGFGQKQQFLIGASIGANLSLQFLSEYQEAKAAVLLSPGLNYRGVLTEPLMKGGIGDKILLVAAEDDTYSAQTIKTLASKVSKPEILLYPTGGHGTDILKNQKEASEQIINWLKTKLI